MCPSSDAMVEKRRASSRHRPRSASARGRNGRGSGTSDHHHKSQRGSSLGQRSARSAGGSRPRKSSAERTSKRHGERHRGTRSSNAEHRDAPAVGQQKVLSLKLSRATDADHHKTGHKDRVHAVSKGQSGRSPDQSPGRRGRSATPKRRSSVEKESHSEKHKGLAGRLRSLFGHKSKRRRGKSLPSRIANLRRNRNDADSAILRQNLGVVSSARSTNWVSEGTVWTEDMSRGDEAADRRQRQRRSASAGRRSRTSSIGSRKSVSQRRSASAGRRSRTSSTNSRKTERLDSVRGQQKASKRRSRSRGKRGNKSNEHCREHFGASSKHSGRQKKKKSHRKSHHRHHQHHHCQGKEKARSKSMPALGGRQPARSVCVDPEELKRRPVSPMASVDSSWRQKRTKKKRRAKEQRKTIEKELDKKARSKSCEPSYDFVAIQRCRRSEDSTGDEQGSRNEDEAQEEEYPGALVPFVQKQGAHSNANANYNLAYNLGEIDGAFICGKEKEGVAVEENETSLPEPSYSSEANDASLPEPSRSSEESEKHEAASESRSERSNSSEPNMLERKPSISHESATVSGTLTLGTEPNNLESKPCAGLDSSSESDTFTVRTEPNGLERKLERQPCAGLDTSSKSDTFTFGMGTIGSGTWHGRAPDPVLSLHGDSTVLSPGGTYDNSFMSPRSGTLRSGAPADPPMGTDSLTSKTDPPATSSAALPDSFIEVASRGNEGSKKAEDSAGDREGRSQDELDPIARDDVVNEADEGSEDGSLFDYAPSTTGTTEQKMAATSGAPPLHVSVRAKKPTGSVASSHKPRRTKPSKGSKAKKDEEKSHDEDVDADTPEHDSDRHDKELEECYPQHRSRNKAIKENISEIVVEDGTDQVSAVTMPAALMKAPPMHARIRAKKPRNRSGLSSHRENKDEEEVKDEDVGPLTGNEIDLHSNSTKEPSEITMPVALRQPFSKAAQPPRLPSPLPEEEPDEEDVGPLTGNEIDLHSNSTKEPSEVTMPVALRQPSSKAVQSLRTPSPLLEEEPATQHLHSEKLERPHQNLGAGAASMPKASSPRPRKVPPPPPRPMPPPPLRSQREDLDQPQGGNSALLEDAAAQLLSVQSGNNWASSSAASIGTTQRSPDGRLVTNMPYTDEYRDTGLYSGETNDYGVPHGRGRMKYDQDGETLEGKWVNGVWCGPDAAQRLSSGLSAFQGGASQARNGSVASKQSARA